MTLKKIYQILGPTLLAGLLTAAAFYADTYHRLKQTQKYTELIAQQIVFQTQTLLLDAREKGDTDPLNWAVGRLSQGEERNRIILVSRLPAQATPVSTHAAPRWNAKTHEWEYIRSVQESDSQQNIQIRIKTRPVYFMGSSSLFWSDVLVFSLFVFLFVFFWKWSRPASRPVANLQSQEAVSVPSTPYTATSLSDSSSPLEPTAHALVLAWTAESKTLLSRLGLAIRQILTESKSMVDLSHQAYPLVSQTRSQVHRYTHDLRRGHDQVKQLQRHCEKLETLSLNMIIEGSRLTEVDSPLLKMASEMHQSMQKMRRTHALLESSIRTIEIGIEPWTKDLDLTHQSMTLEREAAHRLMQQIDQTKDSLMNQARHLQALQDQLKAADKKVQADSAAKRAV